MVVWASLAAAKRCLNGESSGKYEVLLSFEDRELAYQDSYSELKGAWAACRLRGFINISDRSELPRTCGRQPRMESPVATRAEGRKPLARTSTPAWIRRRCDNSISSVWATTVR